MNIDPLPWMNPDAGPNVVIAVILRSAFELQRALPDDVSALLDCLEAQSAGAPRRH